jgi:prepilin-type N-terminal cleavage/methylation domain-containing protein
MEYRPSSPLRNQRGFTLLEIAVVMIIIGILTGGGVSLMKLLTERKARSATVDYLKQARLVLVSFAVTNGRLPWADSDGDGLENSGATSGTLPFLTLQIAPADAYKRVLRYALNTNLAANRFASCNALRTGLAAPPAIVDADGTGAAFAVAAVLVSAGPMDADGNGNVFDAIGTGPHQGNNITGNPNYLRHPMVAAYDDLAVYISAHELSAELCEYLALAVNNNSGGTVYLYDANQGNDIGSVGNGATALFNVISGSRFELWSGAGRGGSIVTSTPPTPIALAGRGATLNISP